MLASAGNRWGHFHDVLAISLASMHSLNFVDGNVYDCHENISIPQKLPIIWYSMCISQIKGINGTMIANRNMRMNSTATVVRTVMTLDNGGEWSYISPPETDLSGVPILCEPPGCSLHFHMDTSAFARLGVYSQVCSYHNDYVCT